MASTRGGNGEVMGAIGRFWRRSYASDYIGFISLFLGYTYLVFTARPFHRLFTLHDTRISFPHAEHERVPLGQALLYSLATPMIVMTIVNLLRRAPARNHHLSLMPFLLAMILTPFVTEVIKNAVGRPRPDLLARCIPAKGTPTDKLVGIEVCTQDDDFILQDGWRSFPSGHSSFAFCGLGYLSLWLCGQAKVFVLRQKGEERSAVVVRGDFIKAMVCGSPLIGAILIAVSRTQDYRHDVWDVSVGALLGFAIGWWSYRRYWPRLTSPYCNEPYAAPLPIEEAAAAARYGRVRDEEEAVSLGRGEDRNAISLLDP